MSEEDTKRRRLEVGQSETVGSRVATPGLVSRDGAPDPTCRIGVTDRSDASVRGVERYGVEVNGEDMKRRRVEAVQSETVGSREPVSRAGPRDVAPDPTCRTGVIARAPLRPRPRGSSTFEVGTSL